MFNTAYGEPQFKLKSSVKIVWYIIKVRNFDRNTKQTRSMMLAEKYFEEKEELI